MNGERRRTALALVAIAVIVLLVIAVLGGDRSQPYGLESASPSGYRGLRLVLEHYGVEMKEIDATDVIATARPGDVVFVPRTGGASSATRSSWTTVAARGVRVVLAGSGPAPGVPAARNPSFGYAVTRGTCVIPELSDVEDVRVEYGQLLDARGARSCIGDGSSAVVVAGAVEGAGVYSVASPDIFTNDLMRRHTYPENIRQLDNSVLAVRLLAPPGTERVLVSRGGVVAGTGTKSTWDFLSTGWQLGLTQLFAAAVFLIWWRGVRHGRVVAESLPVEIAGSELVDAVGDLLRRQAHPERAAETVRVEARRELCDALGVDRRTPDSVLASLVAGRSGRSEGDVRDALSGRHVTTDNDLVAVARELTSILEEVLHV